MKTVVNKTTTALKVPLPRGKSLRLGPKASGQVRDGAEEHPGLKKLIEEGKLDLFDGTDARSRARGDYSSPHQFSPRGSEIGETETSVEDEPESKSKTKSKTKAKAKAKKAN